MMTKIAISDINLNIKTRFRQNLGDLKPLIESIKRHGLLHPIVLSEDNQLICGRRRLAACMQLEYNEIEVTYTIQRILREAEADENNETNERISQSKKLQKLMNSLEIEKKLRLKNDRKESLNLILLAKISQQK